MALTHRWHTADYQTMPWKNGGGITTELAIFPVGARLDHFIWRLSTASVHADGPFSHFPQIDRSLAVLDGAGLVLHDDDPAVPPAQLTTDSAPYRFQGESSISASLLDGPILDLNMMTHRAVCSHFMRQLTAGQHDIDAADAQQVLLYCVSGQATLGQGHTMSPGDLCQFEEERDGHGVQFQCHATEDALLYLITLHFLNRGQS